MLFGWLLISFLRAASTALSNHGLASTRRCRRRRRATPKEPGPRQSTCSARSDRQQDNYFESNVQYSNKGRRLGGEAPYKSQREGWSFLDARPTLMLTSHQEKGLRLEDSDYPALRLISRFTVMRTLLEFSEPLAVIATLAEPYLGLRRSAETGNALPREPVASKDE